MELKIYCCEHLGVCQSVILPSQVVYKAQDYPHPHQKTVIIIKSPFFFAVAYDYYYDSLYIYVECALLYDV